eukprot:363605-Chlamydomonas_euryale.AAC.5
MVPNLGGGTGACPQQLLMGTGIFCPQNEDVALINELAMQNNGDGLDVPTAHIHKCRYLGPDEHVVPRQYLDLVCCLTDVLVCCWHIGPVCKLHAHWPYD